MGVAETATWREIQKTNERLDALIAEQRSTNELLRWLGQILQQQPAVRPHPGAAPPWQEPVATGS